MNNNLAKKIEAKLKAGERPEPPAELLQRLKDDIPAHLGAGGAGDEPAGGAVHRGPWLRGPRLRLMAASLFVVVVGGVVAYRVVERAPRPEEVAFAPRAAERDGVATGNQVLPGPAAPPGASDDARADEPEPQAGDNDLLAGARNEGALSEAGGETLRDARQELAFAAADRPAEGGRAGAEGKPAEEAAPSAAPGDQMDEASRRLSEIRRRMKADAEAEKRVQIATTPPPPDANLGREPAGPADRRERQRLEAEVERLTVTAEVPKVIPIPDPTPEVGSAPRAARKRLEEGKHYLRIAPPGAAEPGSVPGRASTGGTHEPNDEPFGDMFYRSAGVNPFIDTEDDRLSTFGLDVDTGSYTLARSYLERGHLPPPEAIRVEEFVNFFDYRDPAPRGGREDRRRMAAKSVAADVAEVDEAGPARRAKPGADFAIVAEGAPSPFGEGERYALVRFGLKGREIDVSERRAAVLTFVVDVSGSMAREDRLGLVRRTLELLLDELRRDDRVGLVVYGDRGRVVLEPTGDKQAVRRALGELHPGGSTNAEEGLVLGYDMARKYFRTGAINRVILCSDGVANVGRTGPESILERIAREADDGVELTTVGFGMGNYNDVLMEQLADRGDGRYAYVDDLEEARRVFVENLTGTLQTIASDAKVQVEFDPRTVSRYRLLGYENRDVADERFRDDTVDAGEIGAGHAVTALYEIKLQETARPGDRLAKLHLRYRSVASGEVEEVSRELAVRDLAPSWEAASPALKLGSLVAEFAEILRRSYWAREGDLSEVFRRAQRVSGEFAGDARVAELVSLMGRAAELQRRTGSGGE